MGPNDVKLRALLVDVLLIDENQYQDDHGPDQIPSWDSLGMVEIAAAVEQQFGHAMEPERMVALRSIRDIKAFLQERGVPFSG
jgi:acyl carrier protein